MWMSCCKNGPIYITNISDKEIMCLNMVFDIDKKYRRPLTLDQDQTNLPRDSVLSRGRYLFTYIKTD